MLRCAQHDRLCGLGADGLGGGEVAAAEVIADFAEIGGDLGAKFGGAAEFFFVAQAFPKTHFEPSLRYFARKIKQVAFDAQQCAVESRPEPDVGSGTI